MENDIDAIAASLGGKSVNSDVDAIAKKLGGRFESTEGGAATGGPQIKKYENRVSSGGDNTLAEISGATGIGGVMGAAAPQIMQGAGAVARAFPATAGMAPALEHMGRLAQSAGPTARTAMGAISGLAGESAGQIADYLGAGKLAGEGARIAGSMGPALIPNVGSLSVAALESAGGRPLMNIGKRMIWGVAQKLFKKNPEELTKAEQEHLNLVVGNLRGNSSQADIDEVLKGMKYGANKAQERGNQASMALEEDADYLKRLAKEGNTRKALSEGYGAYESTRIKAEKELNDAMNGPIAKRWAAMPKVLNAGEDALNAAKAQRAIIGGQDREMSEIGSEIRQITQKSYDDLAKARSEAFRSTKGEVDEIVNAKQGNGEYIESVPEFKTLLKDLQGKLLNTKQSREEAKGLAPVTEQSVIGNYQRIYDAIKNRRIQTGIDEGGNPTFQTFKTSFEALDEVRRKLGDAFRGKPSEGFDAIGEKTAKDLYSKISDIQKKYVGEPQERLLAQYADDTAGLEEFGTKEGQKLLKKFGEQEAIYQADPKGLPRSWFNSIESIKQLRELTGNEVAEKAARDYATSSLRDADAKGVRQFIAKNSEFLHEYPDIRKSVFKYGDDLERGENIFKKTQAAHDTLAKQAGKRVTDAERAYQKGLEEAQSLRQKAIETGEALTKEEYARIDKYLGAGKDRIARETAREVETLVPDKWGNQRMRDLILRGSPQEWETVSSAIKADPAAKASIFDATRSLLSEYSATRGNRESLGRLYTEQIRPALEGNGLINKRQADLLQARIDAVVDSKNVPEKEKLGVMRRILMQGIAGWSASHAARGPRHFQEMTQ